MRKSKYICLVDDYEVDLGVHIVGRNYLKCMGMIMTYKWSSVRKWNVWRL